MDSFTLEVDVPGSAIDGLGHVNNVEYVRWMQEAATAHADAAGCTAATQADAAIWVVRSHRIDYLRPAFAGETIRIRTWVANTRRAFSLRCYEFVRAADETVLAKAETDWVYLDRSSGRPKSIPTQIRALFGLPVEP